LGFTDRRILRAINNAILQEQEWRDTIKINLTDVIHYFDVIINPIKREDLSTIGVMILARDVTSQIFKLEIFKNAIDQSDDLIVIGIEKPESKIVFVNKSFEKFTGFLKEEIVGANPVVLMGNKSEPKLVQRISDILSKGLIFEEDVIAYKKDNTPYWTHLSIKPIINGPEQYFITKNKPLDKKVV
jgi:PAS domain S-box-containing protein